ncbi:hypothetical protein [Radiobacillus deserti]|uniref:hypothetical protein n=1 Tax=Radiobacillus deserti TaxID=2594883 RepID=UPI00188CEDC8|nr:hypothetical protein [Radiobacillus deserti]
MKAYQIILAFLPIPFLFHFYEYNSHLQKHEAVFLFPLFILSTIGVGITLKRVKWPLFLGINVMMTVFSLILGSFFIVDDGSWFKPVGRDGAIIFISFIYVLGQLIIRWVGKPSPIN